MNMPRRLHPATRQVTPVGILPAILAEGSAGVAISAPRYAGIAPADSMDDACRRQCSSIHSDSGYNLCVQLCRSPGR